MLIQKEFHPNVLEDRTGPILTGTMSGPQKMSSFFQNLVSIHTWFPWSKNLHIPVISFRCDLKFSSRSYNMQYKKIGREGREGFQTKVATILKFPHKKAIKFSAFQYFFKFAKKFIPMIVVNLEANKILYTSRVVSYFYEVWF